MKEYSKPIVDVVSEAAEGVYAASGDPKCDSAYMNGIWQAPKYDGWNGGNVKSHYGCLGCPAYTGTGCALDPNNHYEQAGYAGSYDTDNGNRKPAWEGYQKQIWENNEVVGTVTVDIDYDITKYGLPY